jgi:predicted transcriptional regulator
MAIELPLNPTEVNWKDSLTIIAFLCNVIAVLVIYIFKIHLGHTQREFEVLKRRVEEQEKERIKSERDFNDRVQSIQLLLPNEYVKMGLLEEVQSQVHDLGNKMDDLKNLLIQNLPNRTTGRRGD